MGVALLSFLLIFLPLLYLFLRPSSTKKLPPGPFSWPLIGTVLSKAMKQQPHEEFAKLAKIYGPLMLLKFGVEPVVVASSDVAAMEVLKTHDLVLSGRFAPHSTRIKGYIEHSMVWADCTENWKKIRKICRTELFSTKMLEAQSGVREKKVAELVSFLHGKEGQVVRFADVIFGSILNVLGALIFGKDVYDYDDKSDNNMAMKEMIRELMILASIPDNLPDLYPFLGSIDFQGLRKATAKCVDRMNESWAAIVKERRAEQKKEKENDFLQILIDAGFNDPQIDALLLELFGPGSDTSTSTIEWAMAELLQQPEKLQKVMQELEVVVGKRQVKESDLPSLPYLHAVVKETLRLHPPVPFLLPHRATETVEVMNYTIPKGSQLMVNTSAIGRGRGRDPKTWENPLAFSPERFICSDVDYQGTHFHYIPFGAGRRICPGISLAMRVVRLIMASLIHNFEWCLPEGMHPDEMDMNYKFGVALLKDEPLMIVPKARG